MDLHFDDFYTQMDSNAVSLISLAPPGSEVGILEGLRELTTRRAQSVGRECFKLDAGTLDTQIKW